MAQLINSIGPYCFAPHNDTYKDIKFKIENHYRRRCAIWVAQLYYAHFSSLLTILALIVATVLLALFKQCIRPIQNRLRYTTKGTPNMLLSYRDRHVQVKNVLEKIYPYMLFLLVLNYHMFLLVLQMIASNLLYLKCFS